MMALFFALSGLCFILAQATAEDMLNIDQLLGHLVDASNYDVKIISENLKQSDLRYIVEILKNHIAAKQECRILEFIFFQNSSIGFPFEILTDLKVLARSNCSSLRSSALENKMPLRSALYVIQVITMDYAYVLKELDSTVIRCHNEIKSGAYWFSNVLLFMLPNTANGTEVKNKVFANKHVRLHKGVASLEVRTRGTLVVETFNIYTNTTQPTGIIKLLDLAKFSVGDLFPNFDMAVWEINYEYM